MVDPNYTPASSKKVTIAARKLEVDVKYGHIYQEGNRSYTTALNYQDLKAFVPINFNNLFLDLKKRKIDLSSDEIVAKLKNKKQNIAIELQSIYDLFGIDTVESLIKNYLYGD